MPFNFNRKIAFLTYPHASFDKITFLDHWREKHAMKEYIVAEEKHQDGSPHMHVFFHFEAQVHTRNERYFDYQGHHPNIKSSNKASGVEAIKKYCMKEGDYIKSEGLVIMGKRDQLFQGLLENGITKKFIMENPSVMSLNYNSIKGWLSVVGKGREEVPLKDMPKRRHLWISGPSNTGKTTWRKAYCSLFISEQISDNNDWIGIDQYTEVLYADEYKGGMTVQKLNELCDGRCKLNTKGGSTCSGYPRVVICSNYSIRDCYNKIGDLEYESLRNRFNEFEIGVIGGLGVGFPKFSTYATSEL